MCIKDNSLRTVPRQGPMIERRIDMVSTTVTKLHVEAKDGLFGDLRNRINVVMAQLKLEKHDEAYRSLIAMSSELIEWEQRLKNGEPWQVTPQSMVQVSTDTTEDKKHA